MVVGFKLGSFAALVIGEESKAGPVHAFEQDHAGRRQARGRGGGQHHGIWFDQLCLQRLLKPGFKLLDRLSGKLRFGQTSSRVLAAKFSKVHVSFCSGSSSCSSFFSNYWQSPGRSRSVVLFF